MNKWAQSILGSAGATVWPKFLVITPILDSKVKIILRRERTVRKEFLALKVVTNKPHSPLWMKPCNLLIHQLNRESKHLDTLLTLMPVQVVPLENDPHRWVTDQGSSPCLRHWSLYSHLGAGDAMGWVPLKTKV
jgi:hypothetical protein